MKSTSAPFPFRHLILRLLLMPCLAGVFYLGIKLFSISLPPTITALRIAVYTGSSLAALSMMAEGILLFGRRAYQKLICNMATILSIIFIIVFTIQLL